MKHVTSKNGQKRKLTGEYETAMANKPHDQQESDLPAGLAKPAQRALAAAGYRRLEQLAGVSEAQLRQLHGIGPRALDQLRRALSARGLVFAADETRET